MFQPIKKEIKEEILHKIKTEGLPVVKASEQYGVSTKTIYGWLAKLAVKPPSILELYKLRKENQALNQIIGQLTLELSKLKRGNWR